ncbi:hypothetical protein C8Q78DRAFT_1074199 [Trametes maxima]|nr:hypothetical protein C8Q78DRAFT_1074199 [Trametes maxima]
MIPIPYEVMDLIIEYVGADKYYTRDRASLVSCTLVCQGWRPLAQAHLFRTVAYNVEEQVLDRFLAFLEARPHIACAVRSLSLWADEQEEELSEDDDEYQDSDQEESTPNRDLFPDLLMRVVAALPALSQLKLERVVLLGWPKDTSLPPQATHLSRLVLHAITYKPFSPPPHSRHGDTTAPFDMLSLFDADRLIASGNKGAFSEADMQLAGVLTLPTPARPAVRVLDLRGDDCFLRCTLDRGGLDAERLRVADLCPVDVRSMRLIRSILQYYGGGLVELDLDMCEIANSGESTSSAEESHPGLWGICSLAACVRLKTLRLHYDRSRSRRRQRAAEYQRAYSVILASAPATLHELTLSVLGLVMVDGLFTAVMKEIVPLILQGFVRFPGLRAVRIVVRSRIGIERCMRAMRDLLPANIAESGVVRFEHPRTFD